MPTEGKSHAGNDSGRPRVTDTHGPYTVGDFRVLRVGGIVALHFGTTAGNFILHLTERQFVLHARSIADDQGNVFRALEAIDAERADRDDPADPAFVKEKQGFQRASEITVGGFRDNRLISIETKQLYLAAYIQLKTVPGAKPREIARKNGLPHVAWVQWYRSHKVDCEAALREALPLALKPNGRVL